MKNISLRLFLAFSFMFFVGMSPHFVMALGMTVSDGTYTNSESCHTATPSCGESWSLTVNGTTISGTEDPCVVPTTVTTTTVTPFCTTVWTSNSKACNLYPGYTDYTGNVSFQYDSCNLANIRNVDTSGCVAPTSVTPPVTPATSVSCNNPDGTKTNYPAGTTCPTWTNYCTMTDATATPPNPWQIWAYTNPLSLSSQWMRVEQGTVSNGCVATCANGGLSGPVDCPSALPGGGTSGSGIPGGTSGGTPSDTQGGTSSGTPRSPSCKANAGTYGCESLPNNCGQTNPGTYTISCPGTVSACNAAVRPRDIAVTATLTAIPNRVKTNTPTTLTWNATGINTCTLTKNGSPLPSLPTIPVDASTCIAASAPSIQDTVTTQTTYVLTCTNNVEESKSDTKIVNVVPSYEEF